MSQAILTAPYVQFNELNHLFIELTAQNCNMRCKHCYINFEPYKKVKDFISIDKVKKTLIDTMKEKIQCIYLTGGEPMLHPHFNNILRMCLKRTNVTICTNGMSINDKKARFLRKVENETSNELIIKLSLDDYRESVNDSLRGRGNFRKVVFAVQSLIKHEFNPIVSIVNYENVDKKELIENFKQMFASSGVGLDDFNFSIIPMFSKNSTYEDEVQDISKCKFDCANSRTLTENGIYTCPLLTQDERGRSGTEITDFSKKNYIETSFCKQCAKNGEHLFVNHWLV